MSNVTAIGLFSGDSAGYLHPGGQLTRGEAASIFCQVLNLLEDPSFADKFLPQETPASA